MKEVPDNNRIRMNSMRRMRKKNERKTGIEKRRQETLRKLRPAKPENYWDAEKRRLPAKK